MLETADARFRDVELRDGELTLRAPRVDDVDAIVHACRDALTQRWLPLPDPYRPEHAREFVARTAPTILEQGAGMVRAVELSGALAGMIDLKATNWRSRTTEIGFWVAPDHRGRGVAARAAGLLADWALRECPMERVEIRSATGNLGSQHSALNAGFTREGVLRSAGFVHGGRVDLVVFGKVRADL